MDTVTQVATPPPNLAPYLSFDHLAVQVHDVQVSRTTHGATSRWADSEMYM